MSLTLLIVIFTCVISIWAFNNQQVFDKLKHHPVSEYNHKEYYRILTSGFLHGDYFHLFLNMFVLHEFGKYVEFYIYGLYGDTMGKIIFLLLYFSMIIIADLPTFLKHKTNYYFSSVGASGAVSGIIFIFIMLNPWSMLGLFMIIPIPAIVFGVLYLWYSSWASKNSRDMIDHDAHFFGAIAGIVLIIILSPEIISEFWYQLINNFPF